MLITNLNYRTVRLNATEVAECTDVRYTVGDGKGFKGARIAGHLSEDQVKQTIAGRNQRAAQVKQVLS